MGVEEGPEGAEVVEDGCEGWEVGADVGADVGVVADPGLYPIIS